MTIGEMIQSYGDRIVSLFAGGAGGLVRWLTIGRPRRKGDLWVMVLVGVISAFFLGRTVDGAIVDIAGVRALDGVGSFLTGLVGMGIAGFIVDFMGSYRKR